jgi:hypothetical protein
MRVPPFLARRANANITPAAASVGRIRGLGFALAIGTALVSGDGVRSARPATSTSMMKTLK